MASVPAPFDPDFDDTAWADDWSRWPIAHPPPRIHESGYRIERALLDSADVFGRPFRLSPPLECRLLFDPAGRMWMFSTPQEHIMMANNARVSRGHVFVGGLGLGLYPQYAQVGAIGNATCLTIVERSPVVRDLVEPALRASLRVPFEVIVADVSEYLGTPSALGPRSTRPGRGDRPVALTPHTQIVERASGGEVGPIFDTIFLDTWDTLDAAILPEVNRLRDLAAARLAPGGRVLLWGYRWMVRLFEDACREMLTVPAAGRPAWLATLRIDSPLAAALLEPVAARFAGEDPADVEATLSWCRGYAVGMRP
jgi:hypothetical protein